MKPKRKKFCGAMCRTCQDESTIAYCGRWDAFVCKVCMIFLEKPCCDPTDPPCEFCHGRPDRPTNETLEDGSTLYGGKLK